MTDRPGTVPASRGRSVRPRTIAALVVVALIVVFIVQNRETVQINLFALNLSSPLWLLLVVMVALGVLVGFLLARSGGGHRRK